MEDWLVFSLGNDFDSIKLDLANFRGGATERAEKVSNWSIAGQKIDYCLSSQVSTQKLCTVEYSQSMMISKSVSIPLLYLCARFYCKSVVCICNFIKFCCMIYTTVRYWRHRDPPLSILGDALCSFLQSPDPTTSKAGILSRGMIPSDAKLWKEPQQRKWEIRCSRWIFAASWKRWTFCLVL